MGRQPDLSDIATSSGPYRDQKALGVRRVRSSFGNKGPEAERRLAGEAERNAAAQGARCIPFTLINPSGEGANPWSLALAPHSQT